MLLRCTTDDVPVKNFRHKFIFFRKTDLAFLDIWFTPTSPFITWHAYAFPQVYQKCWDGDLLKCKPEKKIGRLIFYFENRLSLTQMPWWKVVFINFFIVFFEVLSSTGQRGISGMQPSRTTRQKFCRKKNLGKFLLLKVFAKLLFPAEIKRIGNFFHFFKSFLIVS